MANVKYPKDRFDDIPPGLERRGAHRAPRSRGARIASWLWGLGAVAVLVLIGVIAMFIIDNLVSFDQAMEPTPTATASEAQGGGQPQGPATPQRDGTVPVTVLNGTAQAGVAGDTSDTLTGMGWNVVTIDDADSEEHASTLIYYGDAAQEGAALALAQDLGGGAPTLDPAQAPAGTIVVVVGADIA